MADRVYAAYSDARKAASLEPLPRRQAVELTSLQRARYLASLPMTARTSGFTEQLGAVLNRNGYGPFRLAYEHISTGKGAAVPAEALFRNWRQNAASWKQAMDPAMDAVGISVVRASDDWYILVVVLVADVQAPVDLAVLEKRAFDLANDQRRAQGVRRLRLDPALSAVARTRSKEMADRKYFDHIDPDGKDPADHVRAAGIGFSSIAENIQYSFNSPDPAADAVTAWMNSEGHRKNLMGDFTLTGMGVAVDETGNVYFTQLFINPPR